MKKYLILLAFARLTAPHACAQVADTVKLKKDSLIKVRQVAFSRPQSVASYIIPAGLIAYGALSFHVNAIDHLDHYIVKEVSRGHPQIINHTDDFLQYGPAIAVYSLNLFNVKGKHNFADRTGAFLLAEGIMAATIWPIKHQTNRLRPNGFKYSFPSGHAGTAFAGAEFLSQEYGDISPWYTVGGYAAATSVAALRVYNNYHTLSDVLTGAGIGVASAKLSYLVYPSLKSFLFPARHLNMVMMPTYQAGTMGIYIAGRL